MTLQGRHSPIPEHQLFSMIADPGFCFALFSLQVNGMEEEVEWGNFPDCKRWMRYNNQMQVRL